MCFFGRGTCEEEGCVCDDGFAPPYCDGILPGAGETGAAASSHMQLMRTSVFYGVAASCMLLMTTL